MQRGWDAKGLLQPLWGRVGGRDRLAQLTGISAANLSSMNSGKRRMGHEVGEKLAATLGVTIYELGAPEDSVDGRTVTLFDRLRSLEAAVSLSGEMVTRDLVLLAGRIASLEAAVLASAPRSAPRGRSTTGTDS